VSLLVSFTRASCVSKLIKNGEKNCVLKPPTNMLPSSRIVAQQILASEACTTIELDLTHEQISHLISVASSYEYSKLTFSRYRQCLTDVIEPVGWACRERRAQDSSR
jgi:hypothetical protein